mgnify:CR=1 FL=1
MKRKNCWIIVIVGLLFFVSCGKKETLDPEEDYALINAMASARNQSDKGIDVEALETCAALYEKSREMGKVCLCDAFIGYKLFFKGDYDKSLIHLKRAEKNLQYCDSISSFVYSYIMNNIKTTDSILALNYAWKALEKNLEYNNLRRLPYCYLNLFTIGYNFIDFVNFIIRRIECLNAIFGIIIMYLSITLGGKHELYI